MYYVWMHVWVRLMMGYFKEDVGNDYNRNGERHVVSDNYDSLT